LYVNTTDSEKVIELARPGRGLLSGARWDQSLRLAPFEVELLDQAERRPTAARPTN